MSNNLLNGAAVTHRVNGEKRQRMAKAVLPKRENVVSHLKGLGDCLDFARRSVGWTVDQLAGELDRDSKQVSRWMRGEERTQVDVVIAVAALREPFVIALARLADLAVETTVTIRSRRS
jgi:hypothetical protein